MPAKHIFWDNDGTLVNSESIAMDDAVSALTEEFAFGEVGSAQHEDMVFQFAGLQFGQMIEICEAAYGPLSEARREEMLEGHRSRVIEKLEAVTAVDGIPGSLGWLDSRAYVQSVVTSSAKSRVVPGLQSVGIAKYFTNFHDGDLRVFSAADDPRVKTSKPAPDIYLVAMQDLGINPDQVVAVEDSAHGVESAVRAGIVRVIGFTGGSHIPNERKAERGLALRKAGAAEIVDSGIATDYAIHSLSRADLDDSRASLA